MSFEKSVALSALLLAVATAPAMANPIPCVSNPSLVRLQQLGIQVLGDGNTLQVQQASDGSNYGDQRSSGGSWQPAATNSFNPSASASVPITYTNSLNPSATLGIKNSLNPTAISGSYSLVSPQTSSWSQSNPTIFVGPSTATVLGSGNSSSFSLIRR